MTGVYCNSYLAAYPQVHPCIEEVSCSVEYIVTDGNGLQSTSVITWTSVAVPDPPNDDAG